MQLRLAKLAGTIAAATIVLSGCYTAPIIGKEPGATPPKIVIDPNDQKKRTWENPESFGPIPANELDRGRVICSTLDKDDLRFEPKGFHPRAIDLDGKQFVGGGFLCLPK